MKVELLAITPDPEKLIEAAGHICYDAPSPERKPGEENTFIRSIIKQEHLSITEHSSASFLVTGVSRALTHQLVRHRLCSFSQRSQRFVNESQFDYVIPPEIEKDPKLKAQFELDMSAIQQWYDFFKSKGIKAEDARFLLPNACCTEIVVTANLREYRHIFKLRLDKHAQWEIRAMANIMLKILKEHAPNIFFDMEVLEIEPEHKTR